MSKHRRKPGLISRIWTHPDKQKDNIVQEQALRIEALEFDNLRLRTAIETERRRRKTAETALKVLSEERTKRAPSRSWSAPTAGSTSQPQAHRFVTPSWVSADPGGFHRVPAQSQTSRVN